MNTISLKLPKTLDAKLTTAAKRRDSTKSAIVREALKQYFDRNGVHTGASFTDLAREFVGCLDGGPPDLSYNKKHLKGFGK